MIVQAEFVSPKWFSYDIPNGCQIHLCGHFVYDGVELNPKDVSAQLAEHETEEEICAFFQKLAGFYSWVKVTPDNVWAGVDHIRSLPLFYSDVKGGLVISDDATLVRRKIDAKTMDPLACEEFQVLGYVTGRDTLYSELKQLQAGEFFSAREEGDGIQLQRTQFYSFDHNEPLNYDLSSLQKSMHEVTIESIRQLVDYAKGRQLVVPLSGGYDSRLIVALLKKVGYKNILTFTYGVKGNKESEFSKQIANKLGVRWQFIEYTNEMWDELWKNNSFWAYQEKCSGLASYAHIQDWPAVKYLKQNGLVQADAIFVPGHCCVTAYLPDIVFETKEIESDLYIEGLKNKHFKLVPIECLDIIKRTDKKYFYSKFTPHKTTLSNYEFAANFMSFGWRERQAKYICNSVRVYEFFGLDWWLPLWSKEYSEFWRNVPLALRQNRAWYIEYVGQIYKEVAGEPRSLGNSNENILLHAKRFLSGNKFLSGFYIYLRSMFAYKTHPLAFYGQYRSKKHRQLMKSGYTVIGLGAYDFLQKIK